MARAVHRTAVAVHRTAVVFKTPVATGSPVAIRAPAVTNKVVKEIIINKAVTIPEILAGSHTASSLEE